MSEDLKHFSVRPERMFDTVELKMPMPLGGEFIFFRDLSDKSEAMTNFTIARRLPSGRTLTVNRIGVKLVHWSGDDFYAQLLQFGRLVIDVNRNRVLDLPLEKLVYGGVEAEAHIVDNDDIKGTIIIGGTAPFPAPTTTEWKDCVEVTEEQLMLPGILSGLSPLLRRSRTVPQSVSRAKQGSTLATVWLDGLMKDPVGR